MKFIAHHRIVLVLPCFLLGVSGLFYSCQKVININLNSASPQTVVQANITNQPGPYTVLLSQTVNFSDPNVFPPIDGALVIISDNAGNTDTLKENPPGTYTGDKLSGTPGRTYTLSITADGKIYTATSTMPSPVNIDTLVLAKSPFGRDTVINLQFIPSPGITTYYHFVELINNVQQKQVFVTTDQYQLGQTITFPLRLVSDSIKAGDTVTAQLQNISESVYNYYSTLLDANGTGFNTAPSNPTSNISNSALGYFSAYAVTSKSIIVP
jgi:hypothetical protein